MTDNLQVPCRAAFEHCTGWVPQSVAERSIHRGQEEPDPTILYCEACIKSEASWYTRRNSELRQEIEINERVLQIMRGVQARYASWRKLG